LDDLEHKISVFMNFLAILGCEPARHISRANCAEITTDMLGKDKLRMKFSALNIEFNDPSLDLQSSKKICARGPQRAVSFIKSRYFTAVGQSIDLARKRLHIGMDMLLFTR